MKFKFLNLLALFGITSLILTSCIKDEVEELGDRGNTFVKIMESPENAYFFEPFSDVRPVKLFDLRRDAANGGGLNTATTVTVEVDPAALEAYNDEHSTSFELLPDSLFTLGDGFTKTGDNTYQTTFAAGEFAKEFVVNLNGAKWDISHVYALPFKIVDGGGVEINQAKTDVIAFISVKNQYDGTYRLDGAFYHPSQSPGYDPFTIDVELHTTGPNSVKLYVPDFGGYYGPGMFAGELSAFGAQEPEITIDPVTNEATVQNGYSDAVTFYTMAPNYDSHYDPVEKKLYVKYGYNYLPGPVFDPTRNREWTYVFTYLGPR